MAKWLEKARKWLDGETYDAQQAEQFLQDSKNSGRNKSKSELFLQKIKEQVEAVLRDEVTRIPNTKKAYVPQGFIVFISAEENQSLPQQKRQFFEEGLSALILETAREIAGELQLSAKTIKVEVRVDANLGEGEIVVAPYAEKPNRTFEKSVRRSYEWKTVPPQASAGAKQRRQPPEQASSQGTRTDLDTIEEGESNFAPLYQLEIWRDGKKIDEFPVVNSEILIGRDYPESGANIRLPSDDRRISSAHASLRYTPGEEIIVTAMHKNPTTVGGRTLARKGDTATLARGETIKIYEFTLRARFPE